MRIYTISEGDEASIGSIANRLYDGLTADSLPLVESALLHANPQLKEPGAFRVGAVVVAPSIPGLAFKQAAFGRDPIDEVPHGLIAAVANYREVLKSGLKTISKDNDHQRDLLNTNRETIQIDEAGSLADGLKQLLDARMQAVDESKRVQNKMFERVLQDINDW